jgi:hypothetical protein
MEVEAIPNGPYEASFYVIHGSKLVALAYWDQTALPNDEVAADWYLCLAGTSGHHDALGVGGGPLAEEAAIARAVALVGDYLDRKPDAILGFEDLSHDQLPWSFAKDT